MRNTDSEAKMDNPDPMTSEEFNREAEEFVAIIKQEGDHRKELARRFIRILAELGNERIRRTKLEGKVFILKLDRLRFETGVLRKSNEEAKRYIKLYEDLLETCQRIRRQLDEERNDNWWRGETTDGEGEPR